MRILKMSVLLAALIIMSGCKIDTEINLFTTDINDIDDTSSFFAPSVLKIDVTSCEDNKAEIMGIANKYFDVSSEASCGSSDGDEFLEFSAKLPIVYQKEYLPKNLVVGISIADADNGNRKVSTMLDLSRFAALEKDAKEMDSSASLELNEITVNLSNDARDTVEISVPAAFVNNIPEINGMISLDRRENATIILSNIGVAQTSNSGKALIFEIK